MIDEKTVNENKRQFLLLCKENIKRQGIEELLDYLCKSDFFIAPCSTKYHLNVRGGLCQHSLNVYAALVDLCVQYTMDIAEHIESITIMALFHDICKDMYKRTTKPVKQGNVWVNEPAYIIEDDFPIGHGEKSVIKLLRFMHLTNEEIMAIRWHMGAWDNAVKGGDYSIGTAQSMSPFVTLLHCADMIATHVLEK